jgi:hypothetical protein
MAPKDAIERDLAQCVYHLAWRATTTLDFLLKDGNLERYIERARGIRANLTEAQHQQLERMGAEEFKRLFRTSVDE